MTVKLRAGNHIQMLVRRTFKIKAWNTVKQNYI